VKCLHSSDMLTFTDLCSKCNFKGAELPILVRCDTPKIVIMIFHQAVKTVKRPELLGLTFNFQPSPIHFTK